MNRSRSSIGERNDKVDNRLMPLVSLVVPAFNEDLGIEKNLKTLCEYMKSLEDEYQWELIVVDDGSTDHTGRMAEAFAKDRKNVSVIHHDINLGLGQALKTAFQHSRGDYVVTMDSDLSYSPDHIGKLLAQIQKPHVKIVIASPYIKGGKVTNVPFFRKICSRVVNWFLSYAAPGRIHTLTSMVRAYEREFLKTINLKAMDIEVNPEIIYKALMLRARIIEIPAHLDWSLQKSMGRKRKSPIKILRGIMVGLMSAFVFRPYMFFIWAGILLFLISLYVIAWIFINIAWVYPDIATYGGYFDDRFSRAIALVFKQRPHAFFVGGFALIAAFQFIISGVLSVQKKRYFEELFHINTALLKRVRKEKTEEKVND